jgi:uncharacterized protein with PIN domain
MVIDTSALVAIVYNESSAPRLIDAIERSASSEPLLFVGDDFSYADSSPPAW